MTDIWRSFVAQRIAWGERFFGQNLRLCYERLVELKLVDALELPLLDAWLGGLSEKLV